ncbi:DNA polymerase subunit Cdc27 [Lactarius psammicola]|nr:DNA polymerase subunit Cdc27 [Lactarius psammicola]
MSGHRVLDYLTEELVVEKNIVRFLSLGIHVNEAKNELAFYHSQHAGSLDAARATYLISGEPRVSYLDSIRDTDEMAVDEDDGEMVEHSEDVSETKITLVGEAELENSKEQYARIDYIHIYGLSPSPIREPALLCEPAKALREAGKGINNGASSSVALERITGPHVKKRTGLLPTRSSVNVKPFAAPSTSKSKLPGLSRAASATTDTKPIVKSEPKDVKLGVKEEPPKPKPSGKLDFSKAKPAAPKAVLEVCKTEPAEPPSLSKVAPKSEPKASKPKDKPPVERKSTMKFSDSEDESSTMAAQELSSKRSESKSNVRVKKGVILSDDEDEEEAPKRARPKAAYKTKTKTRSPDLDLDLDAGAESELRAMMDIDDDQVTRVSRTVTASESATSPPASDVEMEDRESGPAPEAEPAPAPARKPQRKPKKQVPMGRNGLKKRRVVKSRMKTDDKGYFVTEDYSSYESVDEEAPPPEKPAKAKGKGKGKGRRPPFDDEAVEEKAPAKAPAKRAPALERKPSKPNVQKGGIASYFTKK